MQVLGLMSRGQFYPRVFGQEVEMCQIIQEIEREIIKSNN